MAKSQRMCIDSWNKKTTSRFQIAFSLFPKASLDAHPFLSKWDFIHVQKKLMFIWMVALGTSEMGYLISYMSNTPN